MPMEVFIINPVYTRAFNDPGVCGPIFAGGSASNFAVIVAQKSPGCSDFDGVILRERVGDGE